MKPLLAVSAFFVAALPLSSDAFTLSTGGGDGDVTVGVDGFGAFGSSVGGDGTADAFYNPLGGIGEAGTVYQSGIAVSFGNVRPFVTTGSIGSIGSIGGGLQILSATDTTVVSTFTVGALDFQLLQTVSETFDGDLQVGSVLNQVYTVQNTAEVTNSFDIVRYVDGDLNFDDSISDGGGRISRNGNLILFETDAASSGDASATFLGVTGIGGEQIDTNRFQVSEYSGLRSTVENGGALADFIQNDRDGDGFIDEAFDVTLALRNQFSLAPNEVATYTTQTLFGNSVPPVPGQLETLPLLPDGINETSGAFEFTLLPTDIPEQEIIFFDPFIATGYTYEVTGADFFAVQAPTFDTVADPDGYTLVFGDMTFDIDPGELIILSDLGLSGITEFSLIGIDESLMLDPEDDMAFVTGLAFFNLTGGPVGLTQTPIETFVPAAIPLPASALLLGGGLFGLGLMRRKRAA